MPTPTYPNATHYSPHFRRAELRCHCGCTPTPAVDRELAKLAGALEQLRALVGGPVHVHDAHRCPAENARVGGAKDSQHMKGRAADLHINGPHAKLYGFATKVPAFAAGGLGKYDWGVHVDTRAGVARWDERTRAW